MTTVLSLTTLAYAALLATGAWLVEALRSIKADCL